MVSGWGAGKGERNYLFQSKPRAVMKEVFSCGGQQLIRSWHETLNSIRISYSVMNQNLFLTGVQEWLTFAFGTSIISYQPVELGLS